MSDEFEQDTARWRQRTAAERAREMVASDVSASEPHYGCSASLHEGQEIRAAYAVQGIHKDCPSGPQWAVCADHLLLVIDEGLTRGAPWVRVRRLPADDAPAQPEETST
jgi:hypothetical protein